MKEIIIKIPEGLTKAEEGVLIGKALIKRALTSSGRNAEQKRIGTEISIVETESRIIVQRTSNEKIIEFILCPICNTEYQSNTAKYYYTNYGGTVRKNATCSNECVKMVTDLFPGRTSAHKKNLKTLKFY